MADSKKTLSNLTMMVNATEILIFRMMTGTTL